MPKVKPPSRYDDVVKRPGKWSGKKGKGPRQGRSKLEQQKGIAVSFAKSTVRISSTDGYCVFPITCDTYSGCPVKCAYCFVPMLSGQHNRKSGVFPIDPSSIFHSLYDDPQVKWFVQKKVALEIGGLSDPFPPVETNLGVTYQLLDMLSKVGIEVMLSTKRPDIITEPYLALLKRMNAVVKVSISTMHDEIARTLEPGAISPSQRFEELRRIRAYGIPTVARFNPWLHTDAPYDYSVLRGAVDAVNFEPFRMAVTWRSNFPVRFWESIYQEKAPSGEQRPGTEKYEWAVKKEKEYFKFYRYENSDIPWSSPLGGHDVMTDPYRMREILVPEIKRAVRETGARAYGICSGLNGMLNVDTSSAPFCCCVNSIGYDHSALIPSWHRNQWADYKISEEQFGNPLTASKFGIANEVAPLAVGGGVKKFSLSDID